MPILAKEKSMFPGDLLDESSGVQVFDRQQAPRLWWVVYTKSRQEKSLARDLLAQQIPFYLPQVEKENLIRGRRTNSFVPVFPGYVFMFGSADERVDSMKSNRISKVLDVDEQDQLVTDLRQLANLIAVGAPLTIEKRLCPGRRIWIRNGPLAGFEGTIMQRRGKNRLLIAVHFLQQGVSVEINDFMAEPIWEPAVTANG